MFYHLTLSSKIQYKRYLQQFYFLKQKKTKQKESFEKKCLYT